MVEEHVDCYRRLIGVKLMDMDHLVVLLGMIRDGGGWYLPKRLKYAQL